MSAYGNKWTIYGSKIAILQLEGQNNVVYVHTAYDKVYKMSLIFPTFASDYNQRKLAISSHHVYT